jgi:Flp pilus assembly protein TadB
MRVMIVLVILLAVIAIATYLLARRRTREAIEQRRRADQLEEQVNVWVEAERAGAAPSRRELGQSGEREDS